VYTLYLFGLYLMAMIIAYVFSDQTGSVQTALKTHPSRCTLMGAVIIVLIFPITLGMAFTVVGLPLVLLAWLAFFMAKLLGYVAVTAAVGDLITGHLGKLFPRSLHIAVGVVVLGFLRAVPYVGFLFGALVLVSGLGAAFASRLGMGGSWWPLRKKSPTEPTV
jgi:hypothetical protein